MNVDWTLVGHAKDIVNSNSRTLHTEVMTILVSTNTQLTLKKALTYNELFSVVRTFMLLSRLLPITLHGWGEGQAWEDPGVRTPIGTS